MAAGCMQPQPVKKSLLPALSRRFVALPGSLLGFLCSSACNSSAQCLSAAITRTLLGCLCSPACHSWAQCLPAAITRTSRSLHHLPARLQTQADMEHPDEPKPAPPGAGRQLLVVMRHGQRIDEVRTLMPLICSELSALASDFRAQRLLVVWQQRCPHCFRCFASGLPPGAAAFTCCGSCSQPGRQLLVVMRHGHRINRVLLPVLWLWAVGSGLGLLLGAARVTKASTPGA